MKTLRRGIAVGVLEGPMYAVGQYKSQSCIRERRGEEREREREGGEKEREAMYMHPQTSS